MRRREGSNSKARDSLQRHDPGFEFLWLIESAWELDQLSHFVGSGKESAPACPFDGLIDRIGFDQIVTACLFRPRPRRAFQGLLMAVGMLSNRSCVGRRGKEEHLRVLFGDQLTHQLAKRRLMALPRRLIETFPNSLHVIEKNHELHACLLRNTTDSKRRKIP